MSSRGTAIVTGAAQGIGRDIALRLADDGFDVAVNDIAPQSSKLDTLIEELKVKGRKNSAHIADVSQEGEIKRMIEEVVGLYGGLDVMVANAGIGHYTPLTETSSDMWDRIMSVNARGVFLCYKYAGVQMIKQGRGGRIIGASSSAGKQGMANLSAYCASKFAIRGLTQAAALEFGSHGITVNAYAPGAIDTPAFRSGGEDFVKQCEQIAPLKRIGKPEEIASLVSFLVSKESSFITGQSMSINGGWFFD